MLADKPLDILIVEDDKSVQCVFKFLFEDKYGANVTLAGDMQTALEQARKNRYDLYMTDGNYPRIPNGAPEPICFEFYAELMKINPNARVLLVTGGLTLEEEARRQGIRAMGKSMFTKEIGKYMQEQFGIASK